MSILVAYVISFQCFPIEWFLDTAHSHTFTVLLIHYSFDWMIKFEWQDSRRYVNVRFSYIFFCNKIQIKVHFVLFTNETSTEVPLSDQFCVSAGIAVRALHELIWEATDRKTTDHWPVHSLSSLSLCLPFPSYFISFPSLFFFVIICFLWKVWPQPQDTPLNVPVTPPSSSASTRCPQSPRLIPVMTCDPARPWEPIWTMPGNSAVGDIKGKRRENWGKKEL